MLKNYLKITYRNLKRRKGYALVNVFGLAAGMAACLLIGLYVRHELSYDDFHKNAERIYRVDEVSNQYPEPSALVEIEIGATLEKTVPEVQQAVRIMNFGPSVLRSEGRAFVDVNSKYAGPSFFKLFSFELLKGSIDEALARSNTVVLTRPVAKKIFGAENPMGKTVDVEIWGRRIALEITGIAAEVPSNSHFTFGALISLETLRSFTRYYSAQELWTYVLLREGAQPAALETELQKVAASVPAPPDYRLLLHPLADLYLHYWSPRQGDPRYLYILGAVAAVILLIAVANYTSLATARATQRAREVGIRKVAGAHRAQLAGQFLGESVLVSLLALPVALGLLALALPFFNAVTGTDIAFDPAGQVGTLALLVGLAVLVGLVAGAYPAIFLSHFRPAQVLRERLPSGFSGARLRKGLTVFQFALSAALLFSVAVIVQQLRYVQHKNLGFDEERVVTLPLRSRALVEQGPALRQELARLPGVEHVALASDLPGTGGFGGWSSEFSWKGKTVDLSHALVDPDFIETLDLSLLAGRGFSAARPADSSAYVLNEAAVQALGWATPEAAVGENISFFGDTWRIIGVVENFHYESLHAEIAPLSLQLHDQYQTAALRIAGGHIPGTLQSVQQTWEQFTEMPFAYQFLDERIDQLYRQERRTAQVLGGFAGLALLLACLGLFALATYAVERRTKEISIRKVLGASTRSIVVLLSKDFLKLLAIAFVLAAPLAWFAMQRWLEGFAYHARLGPGLFLGVGAAVLFIAFLTVSVQSVRAALANPAEHLRDE